jgi:hypothetical protein
VGRAAGSVKVGAVPSVHPEEPRSGVSKGERRELGGSAIDTSRMPFETLASLAPQGERISFLGRYFRYNPLADAPSTSISDPLM